MASGGWRRRYHDYSTRRYGPSPGARALTWLGAERIAIGAVPTGATIGRLAAEGVTHVVNCRAYPQVWVSQDLVVERVLLGRDRVVHAPMYDLGHPQPARLWSAAALFAADALADPSARVLMHCQQGRRRSTLVAYAVLRLRGHPADRATELIRAHRTEAELVPAYRDSVEAWLADGAVRVGPLRIG